MATSISHVMQNMTNITDNTDQQVIESFGDRIDPAFKAVLSKISVMPAVLDRIEKNQQHQIEMLELIKNKYADKIDNKLDDISKTLDDILGEKRKDREEEEKRRREDMLEQDDAPQLVSNDANDKKETWGFSANVWAGLLAGAYVLNQIGHMQPQIAGLLALLRSSSVLGVGGSSAGFFGGAAAGATKISGALGAISSGADEVGKTVGLFARSTSFVVQKLTRIMGWMKWLARACKFVLVMDPLLVILQQAVYGGDEEKFKRELSKAMGRACGGIMGPTIISFLGGVLGTYFGGPVGGILGALAGFVTGAIWGTMIGEGIGLALYKLFDSNCKDFSGFEDILIKVGKDMAQTGEIVVKGIGAMASDAFKGATDAIFGGEAKAEVVPGGSPSGKFTGKTEKPGIFDVDGRGGGREPSVTPGYDGHGKGGGRYGLQSPENDAAHRKVAAGTGLSLASIRALANIEDGEGDNSGKYQGIYQLDRGNHPGEDLQNPDTQARLQIANIKEYQRQMRKYLKREPTIAELYMAHQQGVSGALGFIFAYAARDFTTPAAQACVRHCPSAQLNVNTIQIHLKNNIGWNPYLSRIRDAIQEKNNCNREMANEIYSKTVPLKDYVEGFVNYFNDVTRAYEKYDQNGGKPVPAATGGKPEMTGGYSSGKGSDFSSVGGGSSGGSAPSYGQEGKVIYGNDGTKFDKGHGSNHKALDILVSMCYAAGLIPPNSILSFNDMAHFSRGTHKTHTRGLYVDISQGNGTRALRQKLIDFIHSIGNQFGVDIVAEDHTGRPTSYGSGSGDHQHVHAGFRSDQEADKFYQEWSKRNSAPAAKVSKSQPSASPVSRTPTLGAKLMSFASEFGNGGGTTIINNTTQVQAPQPSGPPNKSGKQSLAVASWKASPGSLLYNHL